MSDVRVTDTAGADEVAAVVAALSALVQPPRVSEYERWRRARVDALRRTTER
jgi:hypothetical protein